MYRHPKPFLKRTYISMSKFPVRDRLSDLIRNVSKIFSFLLFSSDGVCNFLQIDGK